MVKEGISKEEKKGVAVEVFYYRHEINNTSKVSIKISDIIILPDWL